MLGQRYFEQRLGDIYSLSPIRYIAGTGKLNDGETLLDVTWELNVSVTGDSILAISTTSVIGLARMLKAGSFVKWQLIGKSEDSEFKATADDLILSEMSYSSTHEHTTYFGAFQKIELLKKEASPPTHLEALVRNLDFMGLEWGQHGLESRRDRFQVNLADRKIDFRNYAEMKHLKKLIKSGRLDRAILGEIHVPILVGESLDEAMGTLDMIEWLTSFLTMNRTFSPLVRLQAQGDFCGWRISELPSDPIRGFGIVDNHVIPGGLKNAIEQTFANFVNIEPKLQLLRFFDMLLVMRNQRQLEFLLAGLLLSYEFFTTMFLTDKGKPPPQESNVQQKLNQLNAYLRFIPKAMLDDTLRKDIRNPLFHQGAIFGKDTLTLWGCYTSYFDLLIQIVFVVVGYTGDYISPINHQPTTVPTTAAKK